MRHFWRTGSTAIALIAALGATPAFADNIVLWVNAPLASGPDAPIYAELKAFEAETGHTVEMQAVPHMEMERNLFVAMSGGAGPDVTALDIAWVAGLADAGLLADVTDKSAAVADQYQPGPLSAGRFKQRQYAMPLYTNNVALYVNNKMLAAAGIGSPPKSWAEFQAAAIAMTDKDAGTFGLTFGGSRVGAFQLYPFIWQSGAEIIADDGTVGIGSPEAIEAVKFISGLYTEHQAMPASVLTAGSWDEVNAPFIQERAGMLISGDWAIGALAKGNPDLDYSILPLPVGAQAATVIGGYNLGINANSKAVDASWELVEWLTGPRSIALMAQYKRLSAQAAAATDEAIAALPEQLRPFMAQAGAGRARPVVAQWSQIHSDVFGTVWDSALRGQPVDEVMAKAAGQIEQILGQ